MFVLSHAKGPVGVGVADPLADGVPLGVVGWLGVGVGVVAEAAGTAETLPASGGRNSRKPMPTIATSATTRTARRAQ